MHSLIDEQIHPSFSLCIYTSAHFLMYTCSMYIYIYIHICTYMYIYRYMHACMHDSMHACIHACMHTYIHACIHTCIHTNTHLHVCSGTLNVMGAISGQED